MVVHRTKLCIAAMFSLVAILRIYSRVCALTTKQAWVEVSTDQTAQSLKRFSQALDMGHRWRFLSLWDSCGNSFCFKAKSDSIKRNKLGYYSHHNSYLIIIIVSIDSKKDIKGSVTFTRSKILEWCLRVMKVGDNWFSRPEYHLWRPIWPLLRNIVSDS